MNNILRGGRAGSLAISLVAAGVGLGQAASAQETGTRTITLDPITVLATKTPEKTTEALAAVSAVRGGSKFSN